jgi:hypothetical protein
MKGGNLGDSLADVAMANTYPGAYMAFSAIKLVLFLIVCVILYNLKNNQVKSIKFKQTQPIYIQPQPGGMRQRHDT